MKQSSATAPTNEIVFAKDNERLRFALNAAGIGIWEVDIPTNKVIWDDRCRELFGLAKDNVLPYEEAIQFIHPNDVNGVNAKVQAALRGENGGAYDAIYRTIGADDGMLRWVNFTGTAYFDDNSQLKRFGGVARDVTAAMQTQEKYRSLFSSIDEGFVIDELLYDEKGNPVDVRILEANQRFHDLLRLTDAVGKTAREVFPNAEDSWFEAYHEVVTTGKPLRFENYLGELDRWFDLYVSRIGEPGTHTFAIVFRDITEERKAKQQLEESEAFNRKVLESSPDCLKVLDAEGHVTFMNANGLCLMEIDDFGVVQNKPWWELWGKGKPPNSKRRSD